METTPIIIRGGGMGSNEAWHAEKSNEYHWKRDLSKKNAKTSERKEQIWFRCVSCFHAFWWDFHLITGILAIKNIFSIAVGKSFVLFIIETIKLNLFPTHTIIHCSKVFLFKTNRFFSKKIKSMEFNQQQCFAFVPQGMLENVKDWLRGNLGHELSSSQRG